MSLTSWSKIAEGVGSSGNGTHCSATMDTTGAGNGVAFIQVVSSFTGYTADTDVSDNKGNTWHLITTQSSTHIGYFYSILDPTKVGASHTFQDNTTGFFGGAISVGVWSAGTSVLGLDAWATFPSDVSPATSVVTGTILGSSLSRGRDLYVMCFCDPNEGSLTPTIDVGNLLTGSTTDGISVRLAWDSYYVVSDVQRTWSSFSSNFPYGGLFAFRASLGDTDVQNYSRHLTVADGMSRSDSST